MKWDKRRDSIRELRKQVGKLTIANESLAKMAEYARQDMESAQKNAKRSEDVLQVMSCVYIAAIIGLIVYIWVKSL